MGNKRYITHTNSNIIEENESSLWSFHKKLIGLKPIRSKRHRIKELFKKTSDRFKKM